MKTTPSLLLVLILGGLLSVRPAVAQQTSAFTYQGQLRDGGTNANGTYAMTFKLFDAASSGIRIGGTLASTSTLANGLFTVNLDFGGGAFNGAARWLEINVAGDMLTPRVQVLPAPYALYAGVAGTVPNGAIKNAQLATNAVATTNIQNNAVNTANIQNSSVTTAKIADGNVTDAKIISVSGAKVSGVVASATFATSAGTATLANSVAAGSVITASLQDGAVIAAKIPSGQVVKSLNGLTDAVTLSAGENVILTPIANDIQISATISNSWSLGGNAGTTPGIDFIGTTDGQSLELRSTSGVGIGTSSPAASLHVVRSADDGPILKLERPANHDASLSIGVTGQPFWQIASSHSIPELSFKYNFGKVITFNSNGNITANGDIAAHDIYATNFFQTSDRQAKENFEAIDGRDMLERVASLPISSWNFKTDAKMRHIGPMAQDFYAAFHVGPDDKHIATMDEGGVALAAIQGLNEVVKEKDAEITTLKQRLTDLEKAVSALLKQKGGTQ